MPSPTRRLFVALLAGLALAACGPSEADQRKAFISFLQTRVLDRPGLRIPRPSQEELKSIGDYAVHFAIITGFHERMDASVTGQMREIVAKALPRNIEDVMTRRNDLAALRGSVAGMKAKLDEALAIAEGARSRLKQPPDLAAIYGAAFDKLVTAPAKAIEGAFPALDNGLGKALAFVELVEANKGRIKISGSSIEVSDNALRARVQAAMHDMSAAGSAINEAQRRIQAVATGR